jgi:maleylpyruvate isomerase
LSGLALVKWHERSATALDAALAGLSDGQWRTEVVTAQGRTVPATETPWMRAREVMVHAVDLGARVTFDDLPADFLAALVDDIATKRSASATGPALTVEATETGARWDVAGSGAPVHLEGTLAAIASYLSGRGPDQVTALDGGDVPVLPAWL